MSTLSHPQSKVVLTCTLIVGLAFMASACAQQQKIVPTWGGTLPSTANNSGTVYRPSQAPSQAPAPNQALGNDTAALASSNGRTTFTQGCTGNFSVRDTRTNRPIASGRAYNSGIGLIALDARGRQMRAVPSAPNYSTLFRPDCNCRAGGNQSGSRDTSQQFAATLPPAASCATN